MKSTNKSLRPNINNDNMLKIFLSSTLSNGIDFTITIPENINVATFIKNAGIIAKSIYISDTSEPIEEVVLTLDPEGKISIGKDTEIVKEKN